MSSSAEELGSTDVGNVKTSVRLHRTGSIEAIVGGHHHLLGSGIGQSAAEGLVQKDATTPPSPMGSQVLSETPHNPVRELHGPEKPSPSLRASHLMRASTHSYSPGFKAAHNYGTSTFSRSLLATATQSSNLHNSRAVLSALRALQDKIHRLELDRSRYAEHCNSMEGELERIREELVKERQTSSQASKELETSKSEKSKKELELEVRQARNEEKIRSLSKELEFAKERTQNLLQSQTLAIRRAAELEVRARQAEQALSRIQGQYKANHDAVKRAQEQQDLINHLLILNEDLSSRASTASANHAIKKRKKKRGGAGRRAAKLRNGQTSKTVGNTGRVQRARRAAAVEERNAAQVHGLELRNRHLNLKERVRQANLGRDPPFIPSGNPHSDNNIYGVTQKQLTNPKAFGIRREYKAHRNHNSNLNYGGGTNSAEGELSPGKAMDARVSAGKQREIPDKLRGDALSATGRGSPLKGIEPALVSLHERSPVLSSRSEQDSGGIDAGLSDVISEIRNEYEDLKERQSSLLENSRVMPGSDGGANLDMDTVNLALRDLERKIQTKARQLLLLEEQHESQVAVADIRQRGAAYGTQMDHRRERKNDARHPRSPVCDTEASEKQQAALDLLRHYKEVAATQNSHDSNSDKPGIVHGGNTSARRGTWFGTYSVDPQVAWLPHNAAPLPSSA